MFNNIVVLMKLVVVILFILGYENIDIVLKKVFFIRILKILFNKDFFMK